MKIHTIVLLSFIGTFASFAHATVFNEVEPNDTRAQATVAHGLQNGDRIRGTVTVFPPSDPTLPPTFDLDWFSVRSAPLPFGIYKHEFKALTDGQSYATEAIGFDDLNGFQANELAGRWFTIGGGGSAVNFGITGMDNQLYPGFDGYDLEYSREAVSSRDLGIFQPGQFRLQEFNPIANGNNFDSIVFDREGRVVPNAFNPNPTNNGARYDQTFDLAPGEYVIASFIAPAGLSEVTRPFRRRIGQGNLIAPAFEIAPDDYLTQSQLSLSTGTQTRTVLVGTHWRDGNVGTTFYRVQVVPEPTSLGALFLGVAILARRRLRAKC